MIYTSWHTFYFFGNRRSAGWRTLFCTITWLITQINQLKLLHVQQKLHIALICFVNGGPVTEVTFPLLTFFGKNVAFVGMFPFNFPCSGEPETFFSSRIRFHLWHNPTN